MTSSFVLQPFSDWSEKDRARDLMSRQWHQQREQQQSQRVLSFKEKLWARWLLEDVV